MYRPTLDDPRHQKRVAVINDMSGFGRCSLTVSIPIISSLRIQCCPVPTSIFSNHTGFPSYHMSDYTDDMQPYIDEWKKLKLEFDGICTGFLGSLRQIGIVSGFLEYFGNDRNIILIDPVMGDNGKLYSTYTPELCAAMRKLLKYADIITPNLTEACFLTQTPYHPDRWHIDDLTEMAARLAAMGPGKIVITGIPQETFIANYCYEKDAEPVVLRTQKIGTQRSGTGDVFASVLIGEAVNGVSFRESVKRASLFVKKCIIKSIDMEIPATDGVGFEECLHLLK